MGKKNKKKNSGSQQKPMSDKEFIKQKLRSLPIGRCMCSPNIEQTGMGYVMVTRLHQSGKVSLAMFLIDSYCLGVKDTYYRLRLDEYEYDDFLADMTGSMELCSYDVAHNWVYSAVAWAEDAGISPHADFRLTMYFLEEDTNDIPLLDIPMGRNGKHFLVAHSKLEASKYLPVLKKNLGDDFDYVVTEYDEFDDDYDDYEEDYDEEDDDDFGDSASDVFGKMLGDLSSNKMLRYYGPEMQYTYKHPQYPDSYELHSAPWLMDSLKFDPQENKSHHQWLDRILALPHDVLRQDLENIIWYVIGRDCDKKPEGFDDYDDGECWILINAIVLLAEVGNGDSSLDVILEVMRQTVDFSDFYFGDISTDITWFAIFKLGSDKLDKLMSFMKEEGLYRYNKIDVMSAVKFFAIYDESRRGEIIEWYRALLDFAIVALPHTQAVDSTLAGFLVCDVLDLNASELTDEVKRLFDTDLVDEGVCDDYGYFLDNINYTTREDMLEKIHIDINDMYDFLGK